MMQDKSVSGTRRTYAVITGATSGLGLAYAKWFGGKGYDLIITGRRKDIIEKRAEEIREAYGCSVEVVLTDLAEEQGTANLLARMDGKPVDVLVNNAGFGLGPVYVYRWYVLVLLIRISMRAQGCTWIRRKRACLHSGIRKQWWQEP